MVVGQVSPRVCQQHRTWPPWKTTWCPLLIIYPHLTPQSAGFPINYDKHQKRELFFTAADQEPILGCYKEFKYIICTWGNANISSSNITPKLQAFGFTFYLSWLRKNSKSGKYAERWITHKLYEHSIYILTNVNCVDMTLYDLYNLCITLRASIITTRTWERVKLKLVTRTFCKLFLLDSLPIALITGFRSINSVCY